jgi:hypothetical protein
LSKVGGTGAELRPRRPWGALCGRRVAYLSVVFDAARQCSNINDTRAVPIDVLEQHLQPVAIENSERLHFESG